MKHLTTQFEHLEREYRTLSIYFQHMGIESDCISPNLVASVCIDYFNWELTSEDIVFLSNIL